ncbi:transposable element Tcb1 transposase [Trichonephila clavipes]|nr:transposable element Tcb1 transposase [Trichonephila clavipes]
MSSRHHIDDFMRGRIIGKIEEGRKKTDVAREFDIAHSVVSRLWKSFKTTGMCSRRHGGGRVRSTTPAEDRYIVLSAKRNRRTKAQQVANQFLAASGKQISRKTVARRLRGGGLYARRPVVCVPLTRQHRTARLQLCREHHNWTEQDWACVLFSDESRFSLSSDCRRQLIWRESGTSYRPENSQEKDRYPTCSIMVWAGIMINGRTRLHVVANGTMTGQRYIDEVLLPHVRLFRGAVGDKFVFMDDNATYPNRIENVWDALGRQVAGRNYPPTNKNTLIRAITKEWDKLPQQLLHNVVQSMDQSSAMYEICRLIASKDYRGSKFSVCALFTDECLFAQRGISYFMTIMSKTPVSCYGCGVPGIIRSRCYTCNPVRQKDDTLKSSLNQSNFYSISSENNPISIIQISIRNTEAADFADTGATHSVAASPNINALLTVDAKPHPCQENEGTHFSLQQRQEINSLLEKYEECFQPGGESTPFIEHRINTRGRFPVAVPPYKRNPSKKEILKKEIDRLLSEGIIEESESPYAPSYLYQNQMEHFASVLITES